MKTTVEISDSLLARAKKIAKKRGVTLRALLESGLRRELEQETEEPIVFRDVRVGGQGLSDEYLNASWERLRAVAYGAYDS